MNYSQTLSDTFLQLKEADISRAYRKNIGGKSSTKFDMLFDLIYLASWFGEFFEYFPTSVTSKISVDEKNKIEGRVIWLHLRQNPNLELSKLETEIKRMKIGAKFGLNNLTGRLYDKQVEKSKNRGHLPPAYSKSKFRDWLEKESKFRWLYINWVFSKFRTEYRPSIDRIDPSKGYSFENIRIMNWGENDALNLIMQKTDAYSNNDGFWDQKNPISVACYEKMKKSNLMVSIPVRTLCKLL